MNALNKPIKAPKLSTGETIGLFAPAGPLPSQEVLDKGINLLKEAGFRVVVEDDILRKEGYLAGSDQRRAQEFMNLWQDDQVKALLAVRGGYGTARLLPLLDLELIRQHPKIIAGFSDLTFLLNGIQASTGLITFHGPMLSTLARDGQPAVDSLINVLTKTELNNIHPQGLKILRTGRAEGRLLGGNLTNLIHLLATPYEPQWQETILFLEDINEPPYRIDRMLTHLKMAGRLRGVKGVILGDFLISGSEPPLKETEKIHKRTLEIFDDLPVWAAFPVGHGPANLTLPLGARAVMDSDSATLSFKQ